MIAPLGATRLVVFEPTAFTVVVVVSMSLLLLLPADPLPAVADRLRPAEAAARSGADA
jgi:hypothetical protein